MSTARENTLETVSNMVSPINKSNRGTPSSLRSLTKSDKKEEVKKTIPDDETKSKTKLIWCDQTEELLIGWADIAACYKWLHDESFRNTKRLTIIFLSLLLFYQH